MKADLSSASAKTSRGYLQWSTSLWSEAEVRHYVNEVLTPEQRSACHRERMAAGADAYDHARAWIAKNAKLRQQMAHTETPQDATNYIDAEPARREDYMDAYRAALPPDREAFRVEWARQRITQEAAETAQQRPATTPESMERWLYGAKAPAIYDDYSEPQPPTSEPKKPALKRETVERFDPFRGWASSSGKVIQPQPAPPSGNAKPWPKTIPEPTTPARSMVCLASPRAWEKRKGGG